MPHQGITRAYIGLGSNLGDRLQALRQAVQALASTPGVTLRGVSSCYETAPVGPVRQGDFLNAAVAIDTTLSPGELLDTCKAIEARMGRQARERWGPREIDIDLLLYGSATLKSDRLVLPHPELRNRAFVMVPLLEIAPELALPDGYPLRRVLTNLGDVPGIRKRDGDLSPGQPPGVPTCEAGGRDPTGSGRAHAAVPDRDAQ